jgi:hypothetical protein
MNLDKRAEKISQLIVKLQKLAESSELLCNHCKNQGYLECQTCVVYETCEYNLEFEWDEEIEE